MTDLNILPPYPALLMQATVDGRKRSMIIVSDLHIGLAPWFQANNVSIDWYQIVQEIERDLERIVTSNNADSIVLLGDIKNTISTIERDDWKIIPKFFESLSKKCEVYFIPGNHATSHYTISSNSFSQLSCINSADSRNPFFE